eukprot:scaffold20971_cov225-Skeletonema_marinoi.AAC.5
MDHFDPTSITHEAGDNWALKAANLRKLVRNLQDYYHEELNKDADFESILSNVNDTAKDSDPDGILAIVELVAVAAISCEDREVFVNRMREISEENLGEFQMFLKGGMAAISSLDDDDAGGGEEDKDDDSVVFDGDENHDGPSSPGGVLFPSHGDMSADGNSELLREREELRKELSDARRELAQIKSQVKLNEEYNKKEKDKLRALNEDIQERLTKREEELHIVEKDLSKQKRSLEEVHNEVNDLKEKSASLADELDVEKGTVLQLRKAEAMVEAYRKKVESLESANQQMDGLENQTQNYADQIMKLERENASIPALEKTLKESQTLAKKLEARNNEAEDALRARNAEISNLKNDLVTSDKSKKMYEDELNELRATQEGAEAAALALSPQADNDKLKRLEVDNSNLKAKVKQLESGASEAEANQQMGGLENQMSSSKAELKFEDHAHNERLRKNPAKFSGTTSLVANDVSSTEPTATEEAISVIIRFRPINSRESSCGTTNRSWRVLQKYNSVAQCTSSGNPLPERISNSNFFTYDKTFGETSTTRQVYDGAARGIVQSVSDGLNGTIFAYGQTSSGKTFTMHGSGSV